MDSKRILVVGIPCVLPGSSSLNSTDIHNFALIVRGSLHRRTLRGQVHNVSGYRPDATKEIKKLHAEMNSNAD